MFANSVLLLSLSLYAGHASAHLAAYAKGMYCKNGFKDGVKLSGYDALNSNSPVTPLYQMSYKDWWFHGVNGCPNDPPEDGEFLEVPAGGSFTVEIASNRGKTSLAFDGAYTSDWPDGGQYPDDYNVDTCITSPNMHTQNWENAAGTAFAISYESDINNVTPENLAVFSVRYHTPWKRVTSYDVPADLPSCPEGGCICAWGWVPNGCGQPNMYHEAFKCKVTGSNSSKKVAAPKAPVWCEDDESKCTQGSKQMIYWHQNEGNNIEVDGLDKSGEAKSPAYNAKLGFKEGPQDDIFEDGGSSNSASSSSSSSSSSSASTSTSTSSSSSSSGSNDSNNNSNSNSNSGSTNSNASTNSNTSNNNNSGDNNQGATTQAQAATTSTTSASQSTGSGNSSGRCKNRRRSYKGGKVARSHAQARRSFSHKNRL